MSEIMGTEFLKIIEVDEAKKSLKIFLKKVIRQNQRIFLL
jgi:hypothetical protein